MAALTTLQLMQLEAPELAAGIVTKNGYTATVPEFLQNLLDTYGDINLAMSKLYESLTSMEYGREIRLGDLTIIRADGKSWTSFFDSRRYFYDRMYRGSVMQQAGAVPTMGVGWFYGVGPVAGTV